MFDPRPGTARSSGAVGPNAILPRLVAHQLKKHKDYAILDFGAGPQALHTKWLRKQGFQRVTAYDLLPNMNTMHDPTAMMPGRLYHVVMASNVLNIQPSMVDLNSTLEEIAGVLEIIIGKAYFNWPSEPNYMQLSTTQIRNILAVHFYSVERVSPNLVGSNIVWDCRYSRKLIDASLETP